jgi:uncharacterized protein (DUF4213/DUF364 family)
LSQPTASALSSIIQALHQGEDAVVQQAQIGPYWTAIVSRRCGLASTPHVAHTPAEQGRPLPVTADVIGRPALTIADWALSSSSAVSSAVGMAAINSLIEPDPARCRDVNARDLLLERAPGRSVAIVGHFPFSEELRAAARQLWILELHPRPGDLPADRAAEVIPAADILAITGVTLINHTFDGLIALRRPGAYVVMLGGSAPLSPILFDYGVDVIGGTIVDDAGLLMRGIAAGSTFRQLQGKHPVLMFK